MTNATLGVLKTRIGKTISLGIAAAAILAATATPAQAQAKLELGASLANLTTGLGDNDGTSFGIPSSFFGITQPGVYASIFAGPNLSIDPQIGLIVVSGGGDTNHILNLAGQVNYYTKGTGASSPYIFGNVGLITATDSDSLNSFGGGVGYRILASEHVAIRLDAKFTHYSDGVGNTISANISLGGLFGKK